MCVTTILLSIIISKIVIVKVLLATIIMINVAKDDITNKGDKSVDDDSDE